MSSESRAEVGTMSPNLKPRQAETIRLILAGLSLWDVARIGRVSRRTLSRWMNHDQSFIDALIQARRDQADAREAIRELATGKGKSSMARLKVALLVLGIAEDEIRQLPNITQRRGASSAHGRFVGDSSASVEPAGGW